MKKALSVLLVLCLAFTLCACGGGNAKADEKDKAPQKTETKTENVVSKEEPAEDVQPVEEQKTGNILLDTEFKTAAVMNGTRTEKIGEYGYIKITKSELKEVTEEQFAEFATTKVKDSGCKWVSIICDDGTGICFASSMYVVADYGKLDNEGCIAEKIGNIMSKDGHYNYTEF